MKNIKAINQNKRHVDLIIKYVLQVLFWFLKNDVIWLGQKLIFDYFDDHVCLRFIPNLID